MPSIGAAVREDIEHTDDLLVLKFKNEMNKLNSDKWMKALELEHERVIKNNV